MGEVLAFKKINPQRTPKGNSLCRSGFHKWEIKQQQSFDVRQGKLVTVYGCKHCTATKVVAL